MPLPFHRRDAQPALWAIGLLLLAVLSVVGNWQCRALAGRARDAGAARFAVLQVAPMGPTAGAQVIGGPLLPAATPVRVEARDATVAFYFAGDQVQVPSDAAKALGTIVRGVAAGQTAVIQAYQRRGAGSGQTAQRVRAVHNLLTSLGIGEDKIRRAEPEDIPTWAQAAEPVRVEVALDAG